MPLPCRRGSAPFVCELRPRQTKPVHFRPCCGNVVRARETGSLQSFYNRRLLMIAHACPGARGADKVADNAEYESIVQNYTCAKIGHGSPFWDALLDAEVEDRTLTDPSGTLEEPLKGTVMSIEHDDASFFDHPGHGNQLYLSPERQSMLKLWEELGAANPVAGLAYEGTPGTGKSMLLMEVMRRARIAKKDVLLHRPGHVMELFRHSSGLVFGLSLFEAQSFLLVLSRACAPEDRPWYLVDGTQPLLNMPVRTFIAALPGKQHLHEWLKQPGNSVRVGRPWTEDEMDFLCLLQFRDSVGIPNMRKLMKVWGGVPRACLAFGEKPWEWHLREQRAAMDDAIAQGAVSRVGKGPHLPEDASNPIVHTFSPGGERKTLLFATEALRDWSRNERGAIYRAVI